jgi:hypothetical protein
VSIHVFLDGSYRLVADSCPVSQAFLSRSPSLHVSRRAHSDAAASASAQVESGMSFDNYPIHLLSLN